MFIIGHSLRGEKAHDSLGDSRLIKETRTEAGWKLSVVNGKYPALHPVDSNGANIEGELYEMDFATFKDRLLPQEPAELELTALTLEDGSGSFAMKLRGEAQDGIADLRDISSFGGWRRFRRASEVTDH